MFKIKDRPVIWYVYNSVKRSKLVKKIIIAISDKKADDKLANFLKKNKIKYFRGNLNNVAERMYKAAFKYKANFFLRISGDSPLIEFKIIDRAIKIFKKNKSKYDLITNIFPRTFPSGQSVEIIKTSCLKKILSLNLKKTFYEHVTRYFYQNNLKFKIKNFESTKKYLKNKYSIDTKKDLKNLHNLILKSL